MGRNKKQKSKKAKTTQTTQTAQSPLYWIVLSGITALILLGPFFRGLFFDRELLPAQAFTALLFAMWWIYKLAVKKETDFIKTPLDYAALALVGAYLLSLIPAVNMRLAVGELLKNINYFMVFWLVADITRNLKDMKYFLNILTATGIGVAVLGVGAAAGTFDYTGAYSGGRIFSSLQYPNTLAAFLTAAYFISTSLMINTTNRVMQYIYSVSNFILFFVFIFTFSRGAWLVFPVVFLIYIIGLPREIRLKAVESLVVVLIPSFICLQGFGSATGTSESGTWIWFIIGIILTLAFTALGRILYNLINNINRKTKLTFAWATAGILGVLVIGAAYISLTSTDEPIVLEHGPSEEDSWKIVRREVSDIEPEKDYKLLLDLDSRNPDDQSYSWRILVHSISSDDEVTRIAVNTGGDTEGRIEEEIPFTTLEDTEKVRFSFNSRYSNTYAEYDNLRVVEEETGEMIADIKGAYKYLPEDLMTRFTSIIDQTHTQTGRFAFYRDAFKIIGDYPVLGAGGGGWQSLYSVYQSYLYWTTEVHSYFLQLWVEAGIIGFAAISAFWILLMNMVYKFIKETNTLEGKIFVWGSFIAAFALGAHSVIDFNLSLAAVSIFLWVIFGLINGQVYRRWETDDEDDDDKPAPKLYFYGFVGIGLVICLVSVSLFVGLRAGQAGTVQANRGNAILAQEEFEKASTFDPFEPSYRAYLAQIKGPIAVEVRSDEEIQEALSEMEKAVSLDRYNSQLNSAAGNFFINMGEIDKGLKYLENAVSSHPVNISHYENYSSTLLQIAVRLIEMDRREEALDYIEKTLDLKDRMIKVNKESDEMMDLSIEMVMTLERAAFLKDHIEFRRIEKEIFEMPFMNRLMLDINMEDIPDSWRVINADGGELVTEIKTENKDTENPVRYIRMENKGDNIGYLLTPNFNMKAGTEYVLSFFARGTADDDSFRIYFRSRDGTTNQAVRTSIPLTEEWTYMEIQFETTEDIEDRQYIRIDHTGNDEGFIEFKELEVWEY